MNGGQVFASVGLAVACVVGPFVWCWIADKVSAVRRRRKLLRAAPIPVVATGEEREACVLCSRRLLVSALEQVVPSRPHMWCVDGTECKSYRDSRQIAEGAATQ